MSPVAYLLSATLAANAGFTTFIGDAYPYSVSKIATDSAGNTYIAGTRNLSNAPGGGPTDVFLTKLDPSGKILFTKGLGGNASTTGNAIALPPSGNIYIAGSTRAIDFATSKALQPQAGLYGAGFIVKLSNDGTTILYSTYFGGLQGPTSINSLATDANGNLYLTGSTSSTDFPRTAGMPAGGVNFRGLPSNTGAFVSAISAAGDRILFSGTLVGTQLGCSAGSSCFLAARYTQGVSIALDPAGNAYIAGNTNTLDLPATSGALDPKGVGAFVAKIAAGGTGLSYLTYVDSAQTNLNPLFGLDTSVSAIAVDGAGEAYIAGRTNDPSFPVTPGVLQPIFGDPSPVTPGTGAQTYDAFLAKVNPTGTALLWSTFLGGTGNDNALSLALDASGDVWTSGTTTSPNFPNAQGASQGGDFLVETNPDGSSLPYSARFPNGTAGQAVAVDSSGLIHFAGTTGTVSALAPGAQPSIAIFGILNAAGGVASGQISPAEVISIYGQLLGPPTGVVAPVTNGFYPTSLSGVRVSVGGVNVPLLYVSSTQINAVVPMYGLVAGTLQVTYNNAVSPGFPFQVAGQNPMAFPGVLNEDGTLNSESNPAKPGSIVSFWATGFQSSFYPLTDGEVATAAHDYCNGVCRVVSPPGATIVYAGAAPGIVAGVTQFNVMLPPSTTGALDLFPFGSLSYPYIQVWIASLSTL